MQGIPKGIDREQAARVFAAMSDSVADLRKDSWLPEEWKSITSILESYKEISASLPVQCSRMYAEIAARYIEQKPALHGRMLAQVARAYAAGPYANAEATTVALQHLEEDMDRFGARTVADVAEALSMAGATWASRIKTYMKWILETSGGRVTNEVRSRLLTAWSEGPVGKCGTCLSRFGAVQAGLRILAAGARVGLVKGEDAWNAFSDRFAAGALNGHSQFNAGVDREMQLLLDAMISCSLPESAIRNLLKTPMGWMAGDSMRPWRIVPLLTVRMPPFGCRSHRSGLWVLMSAEGLLFCCSELSCDAMQ